MHPQTSVLHWRGVLAFATFAVLAAGPRQAFAQADEIQVYDGGLAEKGKFNLTWHNNFTPNGVKTPAFPGAVVADKSFNGVTEWAYGVSRWFEAGLLAWSQAMTFAGVCRQAFVVQPNDETPPSADPRQR